MHSVFVTSNDVCFGAHRNDEVVRLACVRKMTIHD